MAYKRALWHSGLTYRQACHSCKTIVTYTDYDLDFRPWFADGFVYCTKCKTPLRHAETLAINPDGSPLDPNPPTAAPAPAPVAPAAAPCYPAAPVNADPAASRFCSNCGNPYIPGKDHFCSNCGMKLD